MRPLYKGTIVRLHGWQSSGLALLEIDDERQGRISVPCDNGQTVRALDAAFGDFITEGHTFDNGAIAGKEIYFGTNSLGVLVGLSPVDNADPEIVADYEKAMTIAKEGDETWNPRA